MFWILSNLFNTYYRFAIGSSTPDEEFCPILSETKEEILKLSGFPGEGSKSAAGPPKRLLKPMRITIPKTTPMRVTKKPVFRGESNFGKSALPLKVPIEKFPLYRKTHFTKIPKIIVLANNVVFNVKVTNSLFHC